MVVSIVVSAALPPVEVVERSWPLPECCEVGLPLCVLRGSGALVLLGRVGLVGVEEPCDPLEGLLEGAPAGPVEWVGDPVAERCGVGLAGWAVLSAAVAAAQYAVDLPGSAGGRREVAVGDAAVTRHALGLVLCPGAAEPTRCGARSVRSDGGTRDRRRPGLAGRATTCAALASLVEVALRGGGSQGVVHHALHGGGQ